VADGDGVAPRRAGGARPGRVAGAGHGQRHRPHRPVRHVDELAAAVRQALDNVAEHARASRVSLFADADEDAVVVAVRDDGVGFEYDEPSLAAQGKIGLLKSMKGRVEQLGGTMRVDSRPGGGTEVELRVPIAPDDGR